MAKAEILAEQVETHRASKSLELELARYCFCHMILAKEKTHESSLDSESGKVDFASA